MKRRLEECIGCAWYVSPDDGPETQGCEKLDELDASIVNYLMGKKYSRKPRKICPLWLSHHLAKEG